MKIFSMILYCDNGKGCFVVSCQIDLVCTYTSQMFVIVNERTKKNSFDGFNVAILISTLPSCDIENLTNYNIQCSQSSLYLNEIE